MIEMWDKEPDARITSGCARDRIKRIFEAIMKYHKINEIKNANDDEFENCCFTTPNFCSNSSNNLKIFLNSNLLLTSSNIKNSFSNFNTLVNSKFNSKTKNNQHFV